VSSDPATLGGDSILIRDLDSDKTYVKYNRLLEIAKTEGRIDGKYRCPVCGIRFFTFDEAFACCNTGSDDSQE